MKALLDGIKKIIRNVLVLTRVKRAKTLEATTSYKSHVFVINGKVMFRWWDGADRSPRKRPWPDGPSV